jgi:hypothetical protein
MEYNHDLPRLKELRETDRRTFVCAGFQKNDGLRDAADLLGLFFGALIILSLCLIVGGASSDNILLICFTIPIIAASPALLFWKSSLNRKADLLDYQLMTAFPDWKELIEKSDKENQEDIEKSEI